MKNIAQFAQPRFTHRACFVSIGAIAILSACGGDQVVSGQPASTDAARMPMIVAHRGGAADAPENTLKAIKSAMKAKADAIWITVQLSKDGIPVLYRPTNLIDRTDLAGVVADHTADELARMNAGYNFKDANGGYPYRSNPLGIPTLRAALRVIPRGIPIILDMKALPAEPQARAVAGVLSDEDSWSRVTIYSTELDYQRAFSAYPNAKLFESRDATRDRLVKVLLNEGCVNMPTTPEWTAFELHRKLTVTEQFTLGEGRSIVQGQMWTPATIACFRRLAPVKILAISINNVADYRAAACLGVDAVLTDSPQKLTVVKDRAEPLVCSS